jgi:hypothetical protein
MTNKENKAIKTKQNNSNNTNKIKVYSNKNNKIILKEDTIRLLNKLSNKLNVSVDSVVYVLCKKELNKVLAHGKHKEK